MNWSTNDLSECEVCGEPWERHCLNDGGECPQCEDTNVEEEDDDDEI